MSWDDERIERLKQMRTEGLSFDQIAKELRVTRSTISGKLHRLGLCERKTPTPTMARLPRREPARKPTVLRPIAFRGPPIAAVPLPRATADDIARVSLIDLEPNHCRWPVGEPTAGFCGCPKVPGSSYCEGHLVRAYRASEVVQRVFHTKAANPVVDSDFDGYRMSEAVV